jgi:hypothetical protein
VPADDVDQCRLARAVRTEQCEDLAGADLETDAAKCLYARKCLVYVADDEERRVAIG